MCSKSVLFSCQICCRKRSFSWKCAFCLFWTCCMWFWRSSSCCILKIILCSSCFNSNCVCSARIVIDCKCCCCKRRDGGRPLVKSVKVVMLVPVSLRHQQCHNFRKKQLENWTGAGVYTWGFTVSFPLGAPGIGVNYTCLRARGQCPLLIWSSLNTIRNTYLYRTAGRLTAGCREVRLQVWHPWLVLQTSLVPETWSHLSPLCLLHIRCPTPVRKSGWGSRTFVS